MRSALSFCAAVVMLTIAAHATANDGPPVDRGPIHRIPVTTMDDRGPIWHLPPQPPMPRRVVADPGPKPWHVTQIEADKCWDKGASGYGVLVAVLDTGADLSHPLLKGRVADSLDYTNSPIGPNDRNQHGTHTATTVAQVAPACKIAVVKVLGDNGSGYDDDIGKGIDYAMQKAKQLGLKLVISMSLGSDSRGPYSGPAVRRAIESGACVVAAAGNSGEGGVGYPGGEPGVICVAAVDSRGQVASFSSRGDRVDIAAGGVDVAAGMPGGGYQTMSGTSMATPVVAGCAALVLGANGSAGIDTIRVQFIKSASDLPPPGKDRFTGYGLVQPLRLAGTSPNPVPPVPSPMPPAPTPDPVPTPAPAPKPGDLTLTKIDLNDAGLAKLKAAGLADFRVDLVWLKSYCETAAAPVSPPVSQGSPVYRVPAWQPFPVFGGGCPNGQCPLQR